MCTMLQGGIHVSTINPSMPLTPDEYIYQLIPWYVRKSKRPSLRSNNFWLVCMRKPVLEPSPNTTPYVYCLLYTVHRCRMFAHLAYIVYVGTHASRCCPTFIRTSAPTAAQGSKEIPPHVDMSTIKSRSSPQGQHNSDTLVALGPLHHAFLSTTATAAINRKIIT